MLYMCGGLALFWDQPALHVYTQKAKGRKSILTQLSKLQTSTRGIKLKPHTWQSVLISKFPLFILFSHKPLSASLRVREEGLSDVHLKGWHSRQNVTNAAIATIHLFNVGLLMPLFLKYSMCPSPACPHLNFFANAACTVSLSLSLVDKRWVIEQRS